VKKLFLFGLQLNPLFPFFIFNFQTMYFSLICAGFIAQLLYSNFQIRDTLISVLVLGILVGFEICNQGSKLGFFVLHEDVVGLKVLVLLGTKGSVNGVVKQSYDLRGTFVSFLYFVPAGELVCSEAVQGFFAFVCGLCRLFLWR
jgi:hypothetical protein